MVHTLKTGQIVKIDGHTVALMGFNGPCSVTVKPIIGAPPTFTDRDGKHWQDAGPAQGGDGTWRVVKPVPADPIDTLRAARDEWQRDGDNRILSDAVDSYLEAMK